MAISRRGRLTAEIKPKRSRSLPPRSVASPGHSRKNRAPLMTVIAALNDFSFVIPWLRGLRNKLRYNASITIRLWWNYGALSFEARLILRRRKTKKKGEGALHRPGVSMMEGVFSCETRRLVRILIRVGVATASSCGRIVSDGTAIRFMIKTTWFSDERDFYLSWMFALWHDWGKILETIEIILKLLGMLFFGNQSI